MIKKNKVVEKLTIALFVIVLFGIVAAAGGYVSNIVKLIHMHGEASAELIVRLVGIFIVPLGALMGFL